MKKAAFLSSIFLIPCSMLFAQEFTAPDSSAIIKNKLREVNITFINSNGDRFPSRTYRYDRDGRMVYSAEGTTSYYYSFRYDSAGRMCWSDQRKMDGTLIAGYGFARFPSGKMKLSSYYNAYDSLHPYEVVTFDTAGNRIEDLNYLNGKFFRGTFRTFDQDHHIISSTDSTVFGDSGKVQVYFTENRLLRRYSEYKNNHYDNWYFQYDTSGVLIVTLHQSPGVSVKTDIAHDANGEYSLTMNGKKPSASADREWRDKWDYLFPKEIFPLNEFPIADPIAEAVWNHTLTRDKKGNITKDVITPGAAWMRQETVTYTYEYKYW